MIGGWEVLHRHRWGVFFAVLAGIASGVAGGFGGPILLQYVSHRVFSPGTLPLPRLLYYCSLPVLLVGLRAAAGLVNTYLLATVGQALLQSFRQKIFEKLQRLPLSFFQKNHGGDLISRTFNDSNVIQSSLVSIVHEIIQRPMMLVSAVVAIFFLCLRQDGGWKLLFVFLLMGASAIPIGIFGRRVWKRNLATQERIADLTTSMSSNLQAAQEVRAFSMERQEILKFSRKNRDYSRSYLGACKAYYCIVPSIETWGAVGISLALFCAYISHIPGETFLAIATALFLTYDPIKNIGRLYGNLQYVFSALSRILLLLDEPDPPDERAKPSLPKIRGDIEFHHVSFSYTPGQPVLRDICLKLEAGRCYALVGPSGSGKTTLANLLPRFFEVDGGKITVDGHDIRHHSAESLRSQIAIVPQRPTLLHDTLHANILWGRVTARRDEVERAAERARAMEFIRLLPRGLDTPIGEDGSSLSGGQRQRIALARAFLRDAPILILDEPTSALDPESEREIRSLLPGLFRGRTVLLISHRLHWLPHLDEVLVIDSGRIVQRGPHDSLLQQPGPYQRLYAAHTPLIDG
jgi:subfamily B ATP-binding cassette protein MsbA